MVRLGRGRDGIDAGTRARHSRIGAGLREHVRASSNHRLGKSPSSYSTFLFPLLSSTHSHMGPTTSTLLLPISRWPRPPGACPLPLQALVAAGHHGQHRRVHQLPRQHRATLALSCPPPPEARLSAAATAATPCSAPHLPPCGAHPPPPLWLRFHLPVCGSVVLLDAAAGRHRFAHVESRFIVVDSPAWRVDSPSSIHRRRHLQRRRRPIRGGEHGRAGRESSCSHRKSKGRATRSEK